jgi:endonuclease YncB( thermonuclease family)
MCIVSGMLYTIVPGAQRIRLFGIDAPEAGQTCRGAKGEEYRCGQKAALVLDARIGDAVVTCERKDADRYDRTVATCRVYGEDLGAWMVGLGWAVAHRAYSNRYVPAWIWLAPGAQASGRGCSRHLPNGGVSTNRSLEVAQPEAARRHTRRDKMLLRR